MGGLSPDDIRRALLYLISFILSVSVHEYGHAWMATRLGDPLPRSQGRLTLNPIAHIDPIGTILMPLLSAFMAGAPLLAWGRPVQTHPPSYTRRFSMRTGHMLVAVAGPAMNLLVAVLLSVLIVMTGRLGLLLFEAAAAVIQYLLALNLSLLFFNLLPLPPLDGGAVLARFLPASQQSVLDFLQRYGGFILLALMFTGLIGYVMIPARIVGGAWVRALIGMAYG